MAQKMRKNESSAARKRESAHLIEFVCFVKRHQKLIKVGLGVLPCWETLKRDARGRESSTCHDAVRRKSEYFERWCAIQRCRER